MADRDARSHCPTGRAGRVITGGRCSCGPVPSWPHASPPSTYPRRVTPLEGAHLQFGRSSQRGLPCGHGAPPWGCSVRLDLDSGAVHRRYRSPGGGGRAGDVPGHGGRGHAADPAAWRLRRRLGAEDARGRRGGPGPDGRRARAASRPGCSPGGLPGQAGPHAEPACRGPGRRRVHGVAVLRRAGRPPRRDVRARPPQPAARQARGPGRDAPGAGVHRPEADPGRPRGS